MENKLRIVFLGTPDFAVSSLETLLGNGYEVVGVVTSPDKPAGRGRNLQQSDVKRFAISRNLKVFQPTNLKDDHFISELKSLNANLQIVVAFRMLPEIVWNMPLLGTFNLHASLLPKYRGAAPINWAIINGETATGVSTFKLRHEIDTGNILMQKKVAIEEEEDVGSLYKKLQVEGANLLLETVKLLEQNLTEGTPLNFMEQNESLVCEAPKLNKINTKINWSKEANAIHNLVRGLSPYPGANTELLNGDTLQKVKVFKTQVHSFLESGLTNGCITTDNKTYIRVVCGEQSLNILELQVEGKKRLTVKDFLLGNKLGTQARFL